MLKTCVRSMARFLDSYPKQTTHVSQTGRYLRIMETELDRGKGISIQVPSLSCLHISLSA